MSKTFRSTKYKEKETVREEIEKRNKDRDTAKKNRNIAKQEKRKYRYELYMDYE